MTLYSSNMSLFMVGNLPVPGVLQSVSSPVREINWSVQQGVAGVGAATIYRGRKLIESLKVKTLLLSAGGTKEEYDAVVAQWMAFMRAIDPRPPAAPPAWDIDYPTLRVLYPPMGRAAHKTNSVEPWKEGPPVVAYCAVLELIEYKPLKLAKPGPPDPAQIDSRDVPPRDAAEEELQELLKKAEGL